MIKIIVQIEGGCLQSVHVNGAAEVMLFDWDDQAMESLVEGIDDKELQKQVDEATKRLDEAEYCNPDMLEEFL